MDFDDILREFERESRPRRENGGIKQKQEALKKMTQVWIHERLSPELLQYEGALVEQLLQGVREQTAVVEENSLELSKEKDIKLRLLVIESELERVCFVIRSYLRTRLSKIDKYAVYIRSNEEMVTRLSQAETSYMEHHLEALVELYNGAFLASLPSHLHALDDTGGGLSMVDEMPLETPVFVRVVKSIEQSVMVGDEEVDLIKGSIYLLRYSAVKMFVSTGDVVLI